MEFKKHELANGLTIVAECNDEARSASLGYFVQTGARDEWDEVSGVSHFLEHMMFKGTPSRSAADVNREFDEMGAHYNAFTSEEHTVYYASVLPEYQTSAAELLGDIIRPSLREEDFDTEKQVILEEIQMYEDQPPFGADDKIKAVHFAGHPLARSVLGTISSVSDLKVDAMRDYFERRYSPANITLAAAGRIDFARLVETAERVCGGWKPIQAGRDMPPAAPHQEFQCITRDTATLEYVLQLSDAPGSNDADRYAAKVLATILGDDSGSRLYWALVDSGLAEQASLMHHDYQGTGIFMTYMSCTADQAQANLNLIAQVFAQATAEGLTAEELSQAKSKINARVVLGSERPRGRLFAVGGNWMQRREYRTIKEELQAIDAVSLAAMASILSRYPLSYNTTLAIGPCQALTAPAN